MSDTPGTNKFSALQTDFTNLEANLSLQLSFFKEQGNCYLIGEDNVKSFRLRSAYEQLCKLELSYEDTNVLKTFIPLYRNLLAIIALEMQFNLNDEQVRAALDKDAALISGDYVIKQFTLLRQQIQRLLTRYYSYIVTSYSLKQLPVVTAQNLAERQKDDLNNFIVEMFVEFQNEKSEGEPDLLKVEAAEKKSHKLKIDISAQSEVLDKIYWLEDKLPELMSYEVLYESLVTTLTNLYTGLYQFYYQQLYENHLPLPEVISNAKIKFPNATELFINRTREVFQLVASDMTAEDKDAFSRLCQDFFKQFNKIAAQMPIFNFEQAKLYHLIFRPSTKFEAEVYNPFFSVDAQLLSVIAEENGMIISTFGVVNSSKLYDYAAILILGENYNKAWYSKVLFQEDRDIIDKLEQRAEEISEAPQANFNFEKRIFNYISGDF